MAAVGEKINNSSSDDKMGHVGRSFGISISRRCLQGGSRSCVLLVKVDKKIMLHVEPSLKVMLNSIFSLSPYFAFTVSTDERKQTFPIVEDYNLNMSVSSKP